MREEPDMIRKEDIQWSRKKQKAEVPDRSMTCKNLYNLEDLAKSFKMEAVEQVNRSATQSHREG